MTQEQDAQATVNDLEAELQRLREDNADLRASSLIYLELAERLALRVRQLERGERPATGEPPVVG